MVLNSKLVLVEGIPGSGKTTTARFVAEYLEQQGHQVALFLEGDWDHPADYESVACMSDAEYAEVSAQFPEHAAFLEQHITHDYGEWFFKYRKMQHEHPDQMPEALYKALARFDVYELPADKHQRVLLQNWQHFVQRATTEETVYVFECCFLQNPWTTLVAWNNLSYDSARLFIGQLAESVTPLQPKLVYLAQHDPRATLEKVREERPKTWSDFVIWYLTQQEHGRTHGLSGYEGVIEFYATRQTHELEMLKTLPIASIVLSDTEDWDTRYAALRDFLAI